MSCQIGLHFVDGLRREGLENFLVIHKMDSNVDGALIKKEIIHPGSAYVPLKEGTRVKFHFQTKKCDGSGTILDDSRARNSPMELVLGKKFKLEVWEAIVQKMAVNEVAKFTVHKSLVNEYPFVSKTLRDVGRRPDERKHCCGMTIQNEGLGYKDLDELFNNPCDLEFIFELLSVELPEQYERESWQLSDDERLVAVTKLKEKGNDSYKNKQFAEAEESYKQALGMLEQLMLKEKPHDTEWLELAALKVPLLLNFSQCRLIANDYYAVIEHCTNALEHDPDNVKALFRRAKAHVGAWNPHQAKEDYERCMQLDKSLTGAVQKELKLLNEKIRIRDLEDKVKYQKLF